MSHGCSTWYSGQVAVYSIVDTGQSRRDARLQSPVKRVELCLDEAKAIMAYIKAINSHPSQQRFRRAFTALADGDTAVGLLAYYLWRRRAQARPSQQRRRR